jgi:hypothetical protein
VAQLSSLPDVQRDAVEVHQALSGLAALLSRLPGARDVHGRPDPVLEDARRALAGMAEDAAMAAERVVAYLQSLSGAGDGEAVAVPPRLGPYREWVPPRGHLFGAPGTAHRIGELPQPRRADPGE